MNIVSKIRKKVIDRDYEFAIPHFFEEMAADDLVAVLTVSSNETQEELVMKLWVNQLMEERLV